MAKSSANKAELSLVAPKTSGKLPIHVKLHIKNVLPKWTKSKAKGDRPSRAKS